MNKNEQAQAISVMQAQMDGKEVECIKRVHMKNDTGKWETASTPIWNWQEYAYRVKPTPRSFWRNFYHSSGRGDYFGAHIYETKEEAINESCRSCNSPTYVRTCEFREVVE